MRRQSSRRPLGIFWDIENCWIPPNKSASDVCQRIRDFIALRHRDCGFADFYCCCDPRRVSETTNEGLNNNGVIVVSVPSNAKNASDDKLQELMQSFIDNFLDKEPVIVLISGDINFDKTIRSALRRDIKVILIYGQNYSQDLKNLVNESYFFDDIIEDVITLQNDSIVLKKGFQSLNYKLI